MDGLIKSGLLNRKHELVKLAVVVSLHYEPKFIDAFVETDRYRSLTKKSKEGLAQDVNYNAKDVDPDGFLTLLIKRFGGEQSGKKYDMLQALVNFGLWVIYQHFYEGIIKWGELAEELESPSKIPL